MHDNTHGRSSFVPPLYPQPLPQPQAGPYPPFPSYQHEPPLPPPPPPPGSQFHQAAQPLASSSSDRTNALYKGVQAISMDGPDMGYVMIDERRTSGYDRLEPLSAPTIDRPFVPEPDPELNPGIAMALPTATSLMAAMEQLDYFTDGDKLHWAQDVVRLLDKLSRLHGSSTGNVPAGLPTPPQIVAIYPLVTSAVAIIIGTLDCTVPALSAAAYYIRAHLLSTGRVPEELELGMTKDARQAFKDFERAARGGEVRGWFRLGRDYEVCGELDRAKNCYEKGAIKGDGECTYRLALAHLGGQLNCPLQSSLGLDYLRRSADMATLDCPQSAFFFGMLLAGENYDVPFPSDLLLPANSPPSSRLEAQHREAKSYILKAAYLCFGAALHKAGYMHEHAQLGCPYDPLLSVQYYALASQEGEIEADMALSKWFLVGAEGCFEKEETLSRTFADKAAQARLPTGLFALGYYNEVGIGGPVDIEQAKKWYHKAAKRGNQEATGRLQALERPIPTALSGDDHIFELNRTLVRKHTTAKERSDRSRLAQVQGEASQSQGSLLPGASQQGPSRLPLPAPMPSMPSHLPMPAAQDINDWRATVPAPQGTFPAISHHNPMIPTVPAVRPAPSDTHLLSEQHGRTVSSSTLPTMQSPQGVVPHQQQRHRPPSGYGNPTDSASHIDPQLLTPQMGRMPLGTFPDPAKPPRSSSQSTNLTDDSRQSHRQSYALEDPGFAPSSERPATAHTNAKPGNPAKPERNNLGPPGRVQGGAYNSADTFEQMGFVSKPVSSDNDCRIM